MDPNVSTYGPLGAAIIAVGTVVVQFLQNRERIKSLEDKVKDMTSRAEEARQDRDSYQKQVIQWEQREVSCRQSLMDAERRLMDKERQALGLLVELRDMQAKVIELQAELQRRPPATNKK